MKIRELLLNSIQSINAVIDPPTPITINWLKISKIEYLIQLNNRYAISELKLIISQLSEKDVNAENLQPLVEFLKRRWELIRGTDLSYSSNLKNPINQICLLIADEISKPLQRSSF